jgi:hypothetical protein
MRRGRLPRPPGRGRLPRPPGRGGAIRGRGEVGYTNHRGKAGPGHMFIVRGGFESPMIRSRSAPLPSLISIVRLLVLVNGSAQGFTSRGLRQGNPLSPMLFIIVMEALSRMLRAVVGDYISGFFVGNSTRAELSISHSLFADDTLIFCEADSEQTWHLRGVFIWF